MKGFLRNSRHKKILKARKVERSVGVHDVLCILGFPSAHSVKVTGDGFPAWRVSSN